MDNPILTDNIDSLPEPLRGILRNFEFANGADVSTVLGEKGWPVGVVRVGGNEVHTNSFVDPWVEAQHWAETLDYKDVFVSFIYGCGFGYPLLEYAKRKKLYTETVVVERNISLFYAMLTRIDMRPVLTNPSIHFVVGDLEQIKTQLAAVITPEFLLRATKPAAFFTWLAHRNQKREYLDIHEWVLNTLELHLSSVGNSVHDTLVGMYNTLDNVDVILDSPRLTDVQRCFAGRPAIIVSNGPSLDRNADLLSEAVGKSILLTAESALRPCLRRGIIPDGICVTERTPNVYHIHFEQEDIPEQLVMVGLTLMDPRIPRTFPGSWLPVFRSGESTGRWIQQAIGSGEVGLNGGGSSAHLAFEFALWVGANPIIFVGQDLAFGPDQQTHSQLSAYSEDYLADQVRLLQSQPAFEVKGVDGGYVRTTKIWYEFKTWFEQRIRQHPDTRFIDATEGGAYIEGTELMTLREAIDHFCVEPLQNDLRSCLPMPVQGGTERARAYQNLLAQSVEIRDKFRSLAQRAEADIRDCAMVERACALHERHSGVELPAFVESLFQKITNAFRVYAVDEDVVPFTQQLIFATHKRINDIGEVDSVERLRQVARLQRQMFEYLKKNCSLVAEHFDLARERLVKRS
ncbi:motility associated factor glycosyltransferase family protein [Alicyclobacillus sp. ALC3]|uniref:motility associated factor glycosyltransferase family protein n=1 Tax=Alicyclobacillus sp. ALC3 TaxID=2796143 RepID=UPI002378DCE8|nr:6-hydroxymethylpterin diphosphokinase MptE-like protein [Alicyclobacillus sp. ALC3]WDL95146.1 motility associated factor glycosyltransferase family protein [Alicyclobacillus sp. ALC3]